MTRPSLSVPSNSIAIGTQALNYNGGSDNIGIGAGAGSGTFNQTDGDSSVLSEAPRVVQLLPGAITFLLDFSLETPLWRDQTT